MNANPHTNRRAGFSMIEVLVASSILVVIVMLLAMLFQHTSHAWRVGVRRADVYMQIRSAIGAIQRDTAAAVDERSLDPEVVAQLGGGSQKFNGPLQFYTLTGTGANPALRSPTYVSYSASGSRTETKLLPSGSKQTKNSNVLDFIQRTGGKNRPVTTIQGFTPVYPSGAGANGLPLYVVVKARVTSSGNALEIGAASAGPDKTWNTKDDIQTWVD